MRKLFDWCKNNMLGLLTLLLLAFIPLYPKLPLFDIPNTWVYVRAEDFFVLTALAVFFILMTVRKVHLKTPLTMPMFAFWIIGGFATLHGVLLIFPGAANIFANVALLSFLRRIEYMSVFFVAYWGIREKNFLRPVLAVLILTVLAVSLYGLGQRYMGFPAFLTMNEEFAKGVPIQLSALSRIPSTFGGHYDLAAYYVLVLPIILSLVFTVRSWVLKGVLAGIFGLGTFILFLTVSRISLVALIVSGFIVLLFHNKRIVIALIPVLVIGGLVFVRISPRILDRLVNTVQIVDVLVDKKFGSPLGTVKIVPNTYFRGKVVRQEFLQSPAELNVSRDATASVSSLIIPYTQIPEEAALYTSSRVSTGEDLPDGTGYINLTLSPVIRDLNQFYYELKPKSDSDTPEIQIINGPYLIKKTLAYDLSFTTRFQGEWPNTFAAFRKNIFLGSGYGSVSLAVDNSYLRMLGEVGIFGTVAFFALFVIVGLYIHAVWKSVDSPLLKGFITGYVAGMGGLFINAFFIDVFEASKVAFSLWLLTGLVMGAVYQFQQKTFHIQDRFLRILISPSAVISYLCIGTFALFGTILNNYFVGDDFTWLRWAATCPQETIFGRCGIHVPTIAEYITTAGGFFYRPGTKMYFLFMYNNFWLNQSAYHAVSILAHFIATVLVFSLARKIFAGVALPVIAAFLFLIIGGYSEAVSWISATGFLLTASLTFGSLLSYIRYHETKKTGFLVISVITAILSPFFHELGIVTPLYAVWYYFVFGESGFHRDFWKKSHTAVLFVSTGIYLALRIYAGSHWLNGDYSYNLAKLPFNSVGNFVGYLMTVLGGPMTMPLYESLRNGMRMHIGMSIVVLAGAAVGVWLLIRRSVLGWNRTEKNIAVFSTGLTVISLLPFLGLGNITSRYGYMATFPMVLLFTMLMKKIHEYLKVNGRDIAHAGMVLILGIFVLFHVIQLQRMQDNWHEAGETVKQFIVSIEGKYSDSWKNEPMQLHFVHTPLKRGQAWVFPVGLPDAVWFAFHNPAIRIYQNSSVSEALEQVSYNSLLEKVFEFDYTGALTEHIKSRGQP